MSTNAWSRSRRAHSSRSSSALVARICRAHWLAFHFVGRVVRAALQDLHEVPAEARLDRLAQLVQRQLRPALPRTPARYRRARPSPAHRLRRTTPYPRTRLRRWSRSRRRRRSAFANADHLLLHGGVVEDLVRPQQDVPHAELVDHRALGAAHVVQLDDLKSAAALDGLREIAGLHAHDEIGEQRRQLRAFAPAQAAAFERRLRLRRARPRGERSPRRPRAGRGSR